MADIFTVLRGGYRAAKGMKKGDQDKFLSRLELQALLRAAGSDPRKYGWDARDLFFISGNFGLRCSEAIDLELGDFKTLHLG
jgi:integrase